MKTQFSGILTRHSDQIIALYQYFYTRPPMGLAQWPALPGGRNWILVPQRCFYSWRSAAHTHIRRLKVLQSKCLRLATGATWYVSNKQIHEDLGVPLFAEHIRALTASFDSKLADVGNPLIRQLGRYLRWPRVDPVAWRENQGAAGTSRPVEAIARNGQVD